KDKTQPFKWDKSFRQFECQCRRYSMRSFTHVNAETIEEAQHLLVKHKGTAVVNAGGTDLLGIMKDEILPHYPKVVINIKTISGLDSAVEKNGGATIGALM